MRTIFRTPRCASRASPQQVLPEAVPSPDAVLSPDSPLPPGDFCSPPTEVRAAEDLLALPVYDSNAMDTPADQEVYELRYRKKVE